MRLLLIEDDERLAQRMAARLASEGMILDHVATAEAALRIEDLEIYSAVVVDIGLPGMDGIAYIRMLRSREQPIPVLILSARGNWEEKVEGLNVGADDYVVKPIRPEELVARLNALLRRSSGQTSEMLSFGHIELDPKRKLALVEGTPIELTKIEFHLLKLFMLQPDRILSQDQIIEQLYPAHKGRKSNTIEVCITRLRAKIGKDAIRTVRGLGYRLQR